MAVDLTGITNAVTRIAGELKELADKLTASDPATQAAINALADQLNAAVDEVDTDNTHPKV